MKTKLIISLVLIPYLAGLAQNNNRNTIQQFDSVLQASFNLAGAIVPSISVAIVMGDSIAYKKSIGYANVENKILATPDTKYYIASLTKSFTGVLASKLHFEKRLDINRPITDYLKGGFIDQSISNGQITVKRLLTHTSGLENDALTSRAAFTGYSDKESMTNCLYNHTTLVDKSGTYNYDNLGYNIYSKIIENELNTNWKELLHSEIFIPLALSNTSAYVPSTDDVNVAKAYMPHAEGIAPVYLQKNNSTMQSAGGLYSTSEDLGNWILYAMGAKKSGISSEIFNHATSSIITVDSTSRSLEPFEMKGYGLGWKTGVYKDNKIVYHSGAFAGSLSQISFMPNRQIGIVVLMNETMLGGELTKFLLSTFYDLFVDSLNVESTKTTLSKIEQMAKSFPDRISGYRSQLAQREWQLTLNNNDYLGTYYSDAYGELTIILKDDNFFAKFGNTASLLTAYKKPNSARLEFVPLSGESIQFKVVNDKVEALEYSGAKFTKQ